ncbi:MAG: hypothetical protein K6A40_04420 [Solobacterium sp.]|nr:hypothetical protein [Solobacterium sp.]
MAQDLTKEERKLLESVFTENSAGRLYVHQEEALRQLRGAREYLENKYPGIGISDSLFEPQTKMTERGYLISEAGGKQFRTVIRLGKNGYEYADTLYGQFVREAYDASLSETLRPFVSPVRTVTEFFTPMDQSLGKDADVRSLNEVRPLISRHTDLFVTRPFKVSEELLDALRKNGFCGSYSVYRTEEAHLREDPAELKKEAEYLNFSVFDRSYSEGEGE